MHYASFFYRLSIPGRGLTGDKEGGDHLGLTLTTPAHQTHEKFSDPDPTIWNEADPDPKISQIQWKTYILQINWEIAKNETQDKGVFHIIS